MYKTQLKCQKILAYVLLGVAALFFLYALGLMTDIYGALYPTYDPQLVDEEMGMTGEYVSGGKLFYDMQDFNNTVLTCSLVALLVSLLTFITNGHVRRKYYIGNYVAAGAICATNIAVSIITMIGITKYRAMFLQVDFEALKEFAETHSNVIYTESTIGFDLGYAVCALLIVVGILAVLNVIWKVLLMKKEHQMLTYFEKEAVAQ